MPRPSSLLPGYQYEPRIARYRNLSTGRFTARARITELLDDAITEIERGMVKGTTAFFDGDLAASTWLSRKMTMLKREYLQNAALGAGGWDRLTPQDYGRIGGHIRAEYARLANLAEQIAAGEVTIDQALNRVHMYQGGARRMFYETERAHLPGAEPGSVWIERRRLGIAEHCLSCVEYESLGWQPAGTLPVPGEGSPCDGNCRCDLLRKAVPAI